MCLYLLCAQLHVDLLMEAPRLNKPQNAGCQASTSDAQSTVFMQVQICFETLLLHMCPT